jgi:4-hydroxybenzoate polyprenyltransferase
MLRSARDLLTAAHGGPTIVVTLVTLTLCLSSGLEPSRTAVVTAMIFFQQLSIGWSNDALDAQRDTHDGRSDKPIARGDVSARAVLTLAIISATIALGLSVVLGWGAVIAHAVFLISGWAYNLGLKRGVLATVCYAVGFGSLPLIVTLSLPEPRLAAWWAVAMGALLGIAAHFANVIPDLHEDARHGIRALPHRWGARASGYVSLACLAAAALLGALAPSRLTVVSAVSAVIGLGLLAVGARMVRRNPQARGLFRVIMAAALTAVLSLAGTGALIAEAAAR